MNHTKLNFAFVFVSVLACLASAQEIKTEKLLEGLNRPASLTLHPVDQSVYIAEFGSNRIIKIVDGKPQEMVTGFPPFSHSLMESEGGPASIEFLNPNWLLVGAVAEPEGAFQINGFDLTTIKENKPLAVADASATLDIAEGESRMNGHATGMVVGSSGVVITGLRDTGKSFLAKIVKSEARPEAIELLHPAKPDAEKWLDASGAITVSHPEGFLAFIQTNDSGSKLTFFNEEGEENGTFDTGLKKVSAMAYGPNRGRLFLADRDTGAIYKLIESDNDAGCESVKVHELANITAMRFNNAGELLVVTMGETVGDGSGQVIKLIGLDSIEDETKEGE